MIKFTGHGFLKPAGLLFSSVVALLAANTALAANHAPQITGTPPTSVVAGKGYYFKPGAWDADGNKLTFSVAYKPVWATFSSTTGVLTGWPKSPGFYDNIVVKVSDGYVTTRLPTFSIRVTSPTTTTNTAPKISGTPLSSVKVNTAYSFRPTASDANGDKLTFSITNKPAWATFSTSTGQLSGTPSSSATGTTTGIAIRVSDGKVTASLPSFSLTVTTSSTGTATVSWTPPTTNVNGSALTNLAGVRIRYGTNASSLSQTITLTNIGLTRYVIQNLPAGTWYFGLQSYNTNGTSSALSPLRSKTIR